MKITNHADRSIGLAGDPGIVIEPGETAVVYDEHYRNLAQGEQFMAWLSKGVISVDSGGVKHPKPAKPIGVKVTHRGGGWYRLYVNGVDVSQENMRKAECLKLAKNYDV